MMTTNPVFSQTPEADSPAVNPVFTAIVAQRLDAAVAEGRLQNIHSMVLASRDAILVERYFQGHDERWGRPLGHVRFTPETLHDMRSVSKSVVSLLYGIALSEGKVPSPDASLIGHLPRYADLADVPHLKRILVGNVLSMQLGLEWNEDLPYSDPRNSEHAMELAPDRCRYVLERPALHKPGTRWKYSGGATALIGCLLTAGTGRPLLDYARDKLFTPMGIEHVDWVTGHDGAEVAASGLRMRPRDLAKLGQMILSSGVYDGKQLVPRSWLDMSLRTHAQIDAEFDYGYHWWLPRRWKWIGAFGNGGQRLMILPKAGLAVVVTAGNYNSREAWKVPVGVLVDVVLQALKE